MDQGVAVRKDFLLRAATPFFIVGAFATPMLVFRYAGFTIGDAAFLVGAILVALAAAPTRAPQPLLQIAIVLGVVGGGLATLNAVSDSESLAVLVRVLYVWTIWQFGVRKWTDSSAQIATLASAFVLGAALSGIVAIGQAAGYLIIPGTEIVFGRVPGLTGHVNGQGGVMAVAITMGVGLAMAGVRALQQSFAVVFCGIGVLLAGSVTGMLGAAAGVLVVLIASRVRFSRMVLLAAAVAVAIILALNVQSIIPGASSPLERFADTTGQGSGVSTLSLRLLTDDWAWQRIQESLFLGAGLDPVSGATYDGITLTHNMLLLSWFQGGLLFLIAILLVFGHTVSALRSAERGGAWVALVGSCAAAFVFAMTGPVLYERWFWFPFVLAWCLPRAVSQRSRNPHHLIEQRRALLPN